MSKAKEIKVLAFKEEFLKEGGKGMPKGTILKEKVKDTRPGNVTTEDVRSTLVNLVACGLGADMVRADVDDEGNSFLVVDQTLQDVLEMITPNSAYVTDPQGLFTGDSKKNYHRYGVVE